jgi:hypothetical protein
MSHHDPLRSGVIGALRQLRDPLLLLAFPIAFAALSVGYGHLTAWPMGFDFRGTLWEPARALLDGASLYPEPTRASVVIGNPSVYPPFPILASVPFALLPVTLASWLWFGTLGACVFASMWILGVRDWRCHVLAVTSPVVIHGLSFGNLTIVLLLPLAIAWRYRDRWKIVGLAVGAAVAAKLFVWPLLFWLLLTRRFAAAAWAAVSAGVLVLGPWVVIGFDGLRQYPDLLDTVQDVYAVRSASVATVAARYGASVSLTVAISALVGLVVVLVAAWVVRRSDGDRRAFALIVTASILASPIVWPNYAALLLVPIAITWPRLAAPWLFGYVIWLAEAALPKPVLDAEVCCRPADVPPMAWGWSHATALVWYAASVVVVVACVGLRCAFAVVPAAAAGKKSLSGHQSGRAGFARRILERRASSADLHEDEAVATAGRT